MASVAGAGAASRDSAAVPGTGAESDDPDESEGELEMVRASRRCDFSPHTRDCF